MNTTDNATTPSGNSIFRGMINGCSSAASAAIFFIPIALIASYMVLFPGTEETQHALASTERRQSPGGDLMHVKARVRMADSADFTRVDPDAEMVPMEIWTTFNPDTRWLIQTPGCRSLSSGNHIFTVNQVAAGDAQTRRTTSASNPEFAVVRPRLWRETLFTLEENRARAHGAAVTRKDWCDAAGCNFTTMTIHPCRTPEVTGLGLPSRAWLDNQNTRKYVFDNDSGRIHSIQVHAMVDGEERVLFETESIDYDAPAEAFQMIDSLATALLLKHPLTAEEKAQFEAAEHVL